jgi:hypothetical protein
VAGVFVKKAMFLVILVVGLTAATFSFTSAFAAPGDPGEPIAITGCGELEDIPDGSTLHYEITQSFLCGGIFPVIDSFGGQIEGNNHTITGITIESIGVGTIGVIRSVSPSGVIQNLNFADISVTNFLATTGTVVGSLQGTLDNVTVSGIVDGQSNVGGLVGTTSGGYIVEFQC